MAEIVDFVNRGAGSITPAIVEKMLRHLPQWKLEFTQIYEPLFPHLVDQLEFLADVVEDSAEGAYQDLPYMAFAQAGVSFTGGMYNQPANYVSGNGILVPSTTYLRYYQPAFATVDAAFGITRDKWRFEVFGENLSDNHASTFTSSAQFIKSEVPLRPRVVALKVGASF